ncbi:MAG: multifunctional CCA tRNA nucleotidyl transferase/2'3'-cyclic phosphodiesterase/2'nucleotidase/phosphatase, partial [Aquitalea sp.]|nr:multifunctional CCA tRNA nucleotidyl transferase/2'3'-cyclic phosphodiesterase/2'nucleotidase/phosphatase [Aquitalea sp.]
ALRRPERFRQMLAAGLADARGRLHFENDPYPQAGWMEQLLAAALAVDAGQIAKSCTDPRQIPQQVDAARIQAITRARQRLLPG